MATVMISIDGKTLRFACEEGDEERLLSLAGKFNHYISDLKEAHGEIGDYRLSIMAGIIVLDEIDELKHRLATMEAEKNALETKYQDLVETVDTKEQEIAEKIDNIAQRVIVAAGKIAPKS